MAIWEKASADLVQRFDGSLPRESSVERRKMFGYPCAFVNGNMFAGIHEHRLIVRVPDEAAAHPFQPRGRTMKEYAAFDGSLDLEPDEFRKWDARGFAYARALPPKAPKPAKKSAAKKAPAKKAALKKPDARAKAAK